MWIGHVPQGRVTDILLTALAPAIWGSAQINASELLPGWHPLLAPLPAGLLLLLAFRRVLEGLWWGRRGLNAPHSPRAMS